MYIKQKTTRTNNITSKLTTKIKKTMDETKVKKWSRYRLNLSCTETKSLSNIGTLLFCIFTVVLHVNVLNKGSDIIKTFTRFFLNFYVWGFMYILNLLFLFPYCIYNIVSQTHHVYE